MGNRLAKATRRLEAELTARWLVDIELGALQTLATHIRDLVLGNADGPSSLAASLSILAELLNGQIDTAAAIGVHWGI
jgi:hypothetical protein